MIRVTFEMAPQGDETRKRTIGLIEISNIGGTIAVGVYRVLLKKCPPFAGALHRDWRKGTIPVDDFVEGQIDGMHRQKRGVYDLLYLALKACGIAERNP